QAWLAQELGLGRAAIVKKLAGDQSFSLEQLVLTAAAFDITLGQLLGEDILNAKSPRPAMRDEASGQPTQLDTNQQPLNKQSSALPLSYGGRQQKNTIADLFLDCLINEFSSNLCSSITHSWVQTMPCGQ